MRVWYHREQRRRKGRVLPAGHIPAIVIGAQRPDDPNRGMSSNIWVYSEGHPVLVSREQLEPRDLDLPAPRRGGI
eukprot:240329-Alexandrium_andersonii.AAC.1